MAAWVKGTTYAKGAVVDHAAQTWINLRDANTMEPGKDVTAWSTYTPPPPEPTARDIALLAVKQAAQIEEDMKTGAARQALVAFWTYPTGEPAPSAMFDPAHVDLANRLVVFRDPGSVAVAVQDTAPAGATTPKWVFRLVEQGADGQWTAKTDPLATLVDLGKALGP